MPMAHETIMASTYDVRVVALSIVIASVAAYVALSLGERVTENRGLSRHVWLLGGASAMGTGIWSMHFTGMLAFHLPVAISYDVVTVALSLVAAISASGVALAVVSRPVMSVRAWLTGGLLMGSGVAVMHYTGMAAMRLPASAQWDPRIVGASVAIAVVVSLVALWLVFRLRAVSHRLFDMRRGAAAVVMGFAVAGMHYTGMAAATFFASAPQPANGGVISADALGGGAITVVTLLVLSLALAVAYVDRRFSAHELALAATTSHFHAVFANAPVVLFAFDAAGTITMARGRDAGGTNRYSDEVVGRSFFTVNADAPELLHQARRALAGHEFTADAAVDGAVIEMRWTPVYGDGAAVAGVIAVGTDITERRRIEAALQHQAFHDALTGLPNRASLNARIEPMLQSARATESSMALAVVDLNRFKGINDALGHHVGDALLQEVATRIRAALRDADFVARLGGDEFAVLIPDASTSKARALALRVVAALGAPFAIEGHALEIGAAVGLAVYPDHAGDGVSLLRYADAAMYDAKRASAGVAVYDAQRDRDSSVRLALAGGLRNAIARDELLLHYQPVVDLATRRITGVEALVRWAHPTLGELQPGDFIPIAEETEFIVPLTHWVLETALRQVRSWERAGTRLRVAVNLSTRALLDPEFPTTVKELLKRHAVSAHALTLEVTETTLMADLDTTRTILAQLSALGVSISVDDFGTGYSSLGYLAQLPVDEIKIDKCFVLGMHADEKDGAIVRWVHGLAKILGLRVVAEGVETTEALQALVALGCDVAQGFYVSRPLPPGELEAWLASSPWAAAHEPVRPAPVPIV
jgi:diguanylate cyclase (GGDEF)-like protein